MTPTSQYSSPAIYSVLLKNPVAPLANAAQSSANLPCRRTPRFYAVKTASDGGRVRSFDLYGPELVKKREVSNDDGDGDGDGGSSSSNGDGGLDREAEETELVDWEDQILADTLPLVGLVRMILHSGKYKSGDRLSPEHERTILERLLPYHPEYEKKIGCGIDYIMLGYHPEYRRSRCLFVVRKNGELVDFSYWKCVKGLIRKKYPLYADNFILRHFQQRRQNA